MERRSSKLGFRGWITSAAKRFGGCACHQQGNNDLLTLTSAEGDRGHSLPLRHRRRRYPRNQHLLLDADRPGRLRHGGHGPTISIGDGARLARRAASGAEAEDGRRRLRGRRARPTNRTASISPDVNNPGYRGRQLRRSEARLCRAGAGPHRRRCRHHPDRDDLRYAECQGGDLRHAGSSCQKGGRLAGDDLRNESPISPAVPSRARRPRPSGIRWRHAEPVTIGLNCALGANAMRAHIDELSAVCRHASSAPIRMRPCRTEFRPL